MLDYHLEPDGFFKSDYLVLNLDNLLIEDRPKSTIHTVKEIVRAPDSNTYPQRDAKKAKRERATEDIVENGILEELEVEEDFEMPTMEEIENMKRSLAVDNEMIVKRILFNAFRRRRGSTRSVSARHLGLPYRTDLSTIPWASNSRSRTRNGRLRGRTKSTSSTR